MSAAILSGKKLFWADILENAARNPKSRSAKVLRGMGVTGMAGVFVNAGRPDDSKDVFCLKK